MQVTIELLNENALNLLRDLERMSIIRFTQTELNKENIVQKTKKQRNFGAMKGLVLYMAKDFNAPLEDFNEYM